MVAATTLSRLNELLFEAGIIIRDNPDLKFERVSINEHGIHTFIRMPGRPLPADDLSGSDALLDTILCFRAETAAYNAAKYVSDEEANERAKATFEPWLEKLRAWEGPANSLEGAIEALKLARDEEASFEGEPTVARMINAALGYLSRSRADADKSPLSGLVDTIAAYHTANEAYHQATKREGDPKAEWDAYEEALFAFINYPCRSLDEVREKAAFALQDEYIHESLRDGALENEWLLTLFLRSLVGEVAVRTAESLPE
jgi:hypothetical protein